MGDDKRPALGILEDLIGIQSVNPFFGEDTKGERKVANYVETRCREAGLAVSRQRVVPGRENVITELRVGKPEATLLFEAHMDTVSLGSMEDPLIPKYRDGGLYGRGACDTKGSLAAMMHAVEECAMLDRAGALAGGMGAHRGGCPPRRSGGRRSSTPRLREASATTHPTGRERRGSG